MKDFPDFEFPNTDHSLAHRPVSEPIHISDQDAWQQGLHAIKTHGSKADAMVRSMSGINTLEERSGGPYVQGKDGSQFLDFGSFALYLFGHHNKRFIDGITSQLQTLSGTSRILTHNTYPQALLALQKIAPQGLSKFMLLNSGAEAVEAAIKLTRLATGRKKIAHIEGSYHGKTAGALSITDQAKFKSPHHPVLSDVIRIPRNEILRAQDYITEEVAALFVEPIQGEGGIYAFTKEELQHLRQVTRQTKTLLVADEIQCGLGRSGNIWAFSIAETTPDIILAGKSLGGGIIPVSAVIATPEAFAPYDKNPYWHSSTYGANPIATRACAIACDEVLRISQDQRCWDTANDLRHMLEELVTAFPNHLKAISGRGFMLGIHCHNGDIAGHLLSASLKKRLILTPCLSQVQILRVTPPADITEKEIQFAKDALTQALTEISPTAQKP